MAELAGAWRLMSHRFTSADGSESQPWTNREVGLLILTAHGAMSAQIMRPDRDEAQAATGAADATDAERVARQGYVAYFGHYTVNESDQTLVTEVEGALNPSLVGSEQLRHWSLEGDTLTLRPPPLADGTVHELVWTRLS